jgi:salicylate hydroxylase
MPIALTPPTAEPSTALRIIVVGAGIAGLSAAVSLRRSGHIVHIYERSAMNNEVGAAINVPPNASRFLVAWGLDPVQARFVRAGPCHFMDPFTLASNASFTHIDSEKRYGGAALWYAHRVDLHESLKKMATSPKGPGVPATIHLNSYVVGYVSDDLASWFANMFAIRGIRLTRYQNPDAPSITLVDGETIHGDVVVGADGLHSIACETVLGRQNQPLPPAHYNACYRFLIPAAALEEDPETRFWNQDSDGMIRLFTHNESNRRLVSYPCRE